MTGKRSFLGVPFRLCLLLAACLVGTTLISGSGPARASEVGAAGKSIQLDVHADAARKAAAIAFYTNLAGPIGTGNPLLARPKEVLMFEDGSWVLEDLHWSTWGSKTARAAGISSASNCEPNCADGKRTKLHATLTLSSPGTVLGHRVYRCLQLTVPAYPKSDEHLCIKRIGSVYAYSAVTTGGNSSTTHSPEFYGPGEVACGMGTTQVLCEQNFESTASLSPKGAVSICHGSSSTTPTCPVGNPGENTPKLKAGQSDTVGPFRCSAKASAVICVVIKTGKGFQIGTAGESTVT
jgi:hypothetical protein